MRLGEQIDRAETVDLVPLLPLRITLPDQFAHIPRHGMHIATDIDDPPRIEPRHLTQEAIVASLSWRVDDQGRPITWPSQGLSDRVEQGLGGSSVEFSVGDLVDFGVVSSIGDRLRVDLDPTNLGATKPWNIRISSDVLLAESSDESCDSQMLGQR
jgi:hypothetical protein